MDFDLNEEQRLLQDSLRKWTDAEHDFARRLATGESAQGRSADAWAQMAALGLHGLPFAEEDGGFGGGPVETMIVMEAIGRALVTEPWATSVVLVAAALRGAAPDRRAVLAGAVAAGETLIAPAFYEAAARWSLADIRTRATQDGQGWRLDGTKAHVVHGASADHWLASALTPQGVGLFLVDRAAAGVTLRDHATQDGARAADLVFASTPAECLAPDALPAIERAVDAATAALCAEAVGAMDEALRLTVEHLKTRTQFGRRIGEFQALQHRAADMFVACEQARSMALFAAMALDEEDATRRARAVAAAKIQIGKSGRFVGQQAVQLHGGLGVTWESKVAHLFKRLTMIDKQFGDVDAQLDRLAALGGLYADDAA